LATAKEMARLRPSVAVVMLTVFEHEESLARSLALNVRGFLTNEALVVGVESRTSTPVRIPRDAQTLMHPEVAGLFPAGEGAGYAGGIISAALDGERIADAVVNYLKK
jgi:uncharacterized FAD-dependent dehydrogenase